MNHYIQGDAAKSEQIKAAFEKLGYDISWPEGCANPDVINIGVERNGAKYVVAETSEYIKDIIKTHPDYKELELHLEPKFKVGDWVVFNNSHNSIYQIREIRDSYYMLTHTHGGSMPLLFSQGKLLRPWAIEDAKDGDVLATDNGWTCIFKELDLFNEMFSSYCFMTTCLYFMPLSSECHTLDSRINGNIHPATKEQRDLLFAKMREAGYEWDADKKELRKIKPHYDISNFHAGMPVLARNVNDKEWRYVLYSHTTGRCCQLRFNAGGQYWHQCIPFDGNEHLLGTTDQCDERFINW